MISLSDLSGITILILMKQAYIEILKVKQKLSIGNVLSSNKDAQTILVSSSYKSVESIINNEELPIAMFLTSYRDDVLSNATNELSKIIMEEFNKLFSLVTSEAQIRWIITTHIKMVTAKRSAAHPIDVLLFALELYDTINLEEFFRDRIDPNKPFRDNDVFKSRSLLSEKELLQKVELLE